MASTFVERARSLRELIADEAAKPENGETLSPVVVDALREKELFWLLVPKVLGGKDIDLPTYIRVVEEVASSDAAAGWSLMANSIATAVAGTYSTDAHVKRMFGGERMPIMAATAAPSGKMTFSNGVYKGGGRHGFASGIAHADWVSGGSMLYENGSPVMQEDGKPVMVGVFLRKDQLEVVGNWDVVGLQATGSYDYIVPEQEIPEDWTFNQYWTDPKRSSRMGHLSLLVVICAGHTAVMLGMARRALHEAALTASQKKRLYSSESIASTAVFQTEFLKHEALFEAAHALLISLYEESERLVATGQAPHNLFVQRCRQVAAWIHGVCKEIVSYAYGSVSSSLRNPSVLGKYLVDSAVGAQHIIVHSMTFAEAAPPIIESWADDRTYPPEFSARDEKVPDRAATAA